MWSKELVLGAGTLGLMDEYISRITSLSGILLSAVHLSGVT